MMVSGCASRSELTKQADNNAKAADYYESIGQPGVAEKSREMAKENYENALSVDIVVNILSVIFPGEW